MSLISVPGSGTPMTPERPIGSCTMIVAGAVSVMPQLEIISGSRPFSAIAKRSSFSQTSCGSEAPA